MLKNYNFLFLEPLSKDTTTSTKTLQRKDSDIEKIKLEIIKIKSALSKREFIEEDPNIYI